MNLFLLALKEIFYYRKRTLNYLVAIILTSVILFAGGLSFSTIRDSSIKEIEKFNGRHHVSYHNVTKEQLTKLKNDDRIDEWGIVNEVALNDDIQILELSGSFFKERALLEGNFNLDKNTFITTSHLAEQNNYKVGNNYNITYNDETYNLKLQGIYEDYYPKVILSGEVQQSNTVYITLKKINTKTYTVIDEISVYLEKESYFDRYEGTLKYKDVVINNSLLNLKGSFDDNTGLKATIFLGMFLVLTVIGFVCFFGIYNAFSIALRERKKQLGIWASLGASPQTRFNIIFIESLIVTTIGMIIGFGLSLLFTHLFIEFTNEKLKILKVSLELSIHIPYIITSMLFILTTILLATFFIGVRAYRLSPIEAIRSQEDIRDNKRKTHSDTLLKLLGIEMLISRLNQKRDSRKYSLAIFTIFLSFIFYITMGTFINHLGENINEGIRNTSYDMTLSISDYDDSKIKRWLNEIEEHHSVKEMVSVKHKTLELPELAIFDGKINQEYLLNKSSINFAYIHGLDKKNYEQLKKLNNLKTDGILLYNKINIYNTVSETSKEYHLFNLNEKIDLPLCIKDNCDTLLKNVTVIENLLDNQIFSTSSYLWTIFMPIEEIETLPTITNSEDITLIQNEIILYLKVADYRDTLSLFELLKANYPLERFQLFNDAEQTELAKAEMFAAKLVLYIFGVAIFSVAIISVANIVNSNFTLRKKELAMMKSIGLSPFGFFKLITIDSLFFWFKAMLYSIPVSIGIVLGIKYILSLSYIDNLEYFNFIFPYSYFIIGLIATLILVLLTNYYQLWKFRKNNIVDELKND